MIRYINSLCGAGKTYFAVNLSKELVNNKKRVLFVTPSTDLQYEIAKRLGNTPYKIINYMENDSMGVTKAINAYLTIPLRCEVLIITHAAFKNILNFPNKKNWTVFVDEEIEPTDFITFDSDDASSYEFGNDLMADIEKISTCKINAGGYTSIKRKRLSKEDQRFLKTLCFRDDFIYPPFQKFIQLILNPNMKIYADTASLTAFKFGNYEAEMWAELNTNIFEGFENIYLMGAEIQRSKIIAYFKLKGIAIEEFVIPKRFDKHDQPITIKWMTEKISLWSKNYYNSKNLIEPTLTNFELFDLLVGNSIGDNEILLQNNKGNKFTHIKNPIFMPFEVKGLNTYVGTHNYGESGAYRWPPAYQKKMVDLGFDADEILMHHTLSHSYQGLLRSSLRTGAYNNNIVYLPTKAMAQNMRNLFFPNATVEQIEEANYFFK